VSDAVRIPVGKLAAGERPSPAEVGAAFQAILAGEVEPALMAAFLMALRIRGETTEDIIAGATAMRAAVLRVKAPADAVDTCGTGGLSWASLNTSTAAAFVAAGAGAVVAKHGNRSKSRAGSADVLEALGVNLQPSEAQLAASFRDARVGFMFAPQHHTAMKHVAPVRASLGIRTIFNMIGPLANPAGARRQVLGVFAPEWVEPLAHALQGLGSETAWVVHGQDGIDEISTTGPTLVAELKNGAVTRFELTPEDLGLPRVSMDVLRGGTVQENAASLRRVLDGEPGPFADLVAVNAAAALVAAGIAPSLKAGIALARESIASGKAMASFEALKAASNG
jgi:anthranilate phosphoribosyltransferase